jgi:glycosyltransferase involved in cell wall biosynthesis
MISYVLIGDAQSPHLLKWASELNGRVNLWVVSSRQFLPEFDAFLPDNKRFMFGARADLRGWLNVFLKIRQLGNWLVKIDADWINPHYLTSHGLLAAIVRRMFGLRARLVCSAWGSDVLCAPLRGRVQKFMIKWTIGQCDLMTSDSHYMANVMRLLRPCDVMTFPFGLSELPLLEPKNARLFFANRGLEPIYKPFRVLEIFKEISNVWPDARLVVANSGSLKESLVQWVVNAGLTNCVKFVGRLSVDDQARYYAQSRWFFSVPSSDAISVSILEAMSHGCFPIVSDIPANRELIDDTVNGLIVPDGQVRIFHLLPKDNSVLDAIGKKNREWIELHALFGPCIQQFLFRLQELSPVQEK